MIEIGRLCVKIAGRDAGNKCVVVEIIDDNYVLIDGNVRRKKCNIMHLEPLDDKIKIKKGASHDAVASEFKKLKLPVWEKKTKEKKERLRKVRVKRKTAIKAAMEAKGKKKKVKKVKKTKVSKEAKFVAKGKEIFKETGKKIEPLIKK